MRFAYADPPYYGHGKRLYGEFHEQAADWDDRETHFMLIERLTDEYPDGWALSCNPSDLEWLLPYIMVDVRVCAWVKSFHNLRQWLNIQYSWEPVILREGRIVKNRKPYLRDHLVCPIAMKKGLPGAKPDAFCDWILNLLGFDPTTDTIDDLFPGTGGISEAVNRSRRITTCDDPQQTFDWEGEPA